MNMSASCPKTSQPSRKLSQLILQRLAGVKNYTVAQAINKDESTVSRIVSGESGIKLDDLENFLGALDLKCVGRNQVCVDREEYAAFRALAARYIEQPPKLEWSEQ